MGKQATYSAMGGGLMSLGQAVNTLGQTYIQSMRDENMARLEGMKFVFSANQHAAEKQADRDFQREMYDKKTEGSLNIEAIRAGNNRANTEYADQLATARNQNNQVHAEKIAGMNHQASKDNVAIRNTLEGLSNIDSSATRQINKLDSQVANGSLMPEQAESLKHRILRNSQAERDNYIVENYDTLKESGKHIEPSFVGSAEYEVFKQRLEENNAIQEGTTEREIWHAYTKMSNGMQDAPAENTAGSGKPTVSESHTAVSSVTEPPRPGLLQSARIKQRQGEVLSDNEALASYKARAQERIQHYSLTAGDRQKLDNATGIREVDLLLNEFKQKYSA